MAKIKELYRAGQPDLLVLEPSEMVVSREIRDVAAMGQRDIRYQVGPLITLLDAETFDFNWQERQALLTGQMRGADLVLLSRSDLVEESKLERIAEVLSAQDIKASPLSTVANRGLYLVLETIIRCGPN